MAGRTIRVATMLAMALLAWSGCIVDPPPPKPAPPPPPPQLPAVPPPPPPAPLAPLGPVRVLYQDNWHGSVQLLGIDATNQRAFLRMEAAEPKRLVIDTIDFQNGKRLDRWEASSDNAEQSVQGYPVFRQLTGTFQEDLVRYAGFLRAAGPWHARGRSFRPTVAVSNPGGPILYGARPTDQSDGDWLFLVDKDGARPRRIDSGIRASYSPVFSPGGERIAWKGCVASPCGYALFVAKSTGGKPEQVNNIAEPSAPVWSSDGRFVYVVANPTQPGKRDKGPCLYKVPVAATWDLKAIRCMPGLRDVEFVQDPGGRTGVLVGSRGMTGQQVAEYAWLLLEDGSVLALHSIDRASGIGVLSEAGLLLVALQKGGVGFIDLVSGKSAGVRDSEGWFLGLESTKWLGDTVVLLRRGTAPPAFDLVAIAARDVAR